MKSILRTMTASAVFFVAIVGCNLSERAEKAMESNSNIQKANTNSTNSDANTETLSERVMDVALENQVGIPECDTVIDMLSKQDRTPGEGYHEKAKRLVFESQLSHNEKRGNKKELTQVCIKLKEQLDSYQQEKSETEEKEK
jgi:hypothetical protein